MITKKRKNLPLISFLILWLIVILKYAAKDNFDFTYFLLWIGMALGYSAVAGIVGFVVGGFVLFNIFLFFYNVFRPDNRLSLSTYDRVTTGLSFMVIIELFSLIGGFI